MLSVRNVRWAWASSTRPRVAIRFSSSISSGSTRIRLSMSSCLPGLGIISELLPVFARKPLFGYRWIALSSVAIALVGFIVWGHHMFTSGYAPHLRVWFMLSTLLVAVPTGVKFFSWLGTMWGGKLTFPTPMLFVLGAISVFLLGGLSGPVLATVASDLPLHDTYFVVGHFHATIFGGFVFPFFAAIYLLVSQNYRSYVQRDIG